MNECSECKKWIHYECTDLPRYMICSLTKGKRKFSCQNCVGNDEISKYTKMFNKKEQYNEEEINNTVNIEIQIEITIEEKEMKNLLSIENLLKSMKLLLEEKEHKINILEETQSKTETTISVMKEEIENFKNEKKKSKQTQLNKKRKKYMQKIKQYRYRIMKISVVKMIQQLKNKKRKSN